jgi:hypothetical protein
MGYLVLRSEQNNISKLMEECYRRRASTITTTALGRPSMLAWDPRLLALPAAASPTRDPDYAGL